MRAMDGPVAVVLAGGRSSRMGRDKATLVVGGRTLAQRAADLLGSVCPEVLVADRGRGVVPGLPSAEDGPGRGPAGGLLGAARHVPGRPLLALACDLPRVPAALLGALVELAARRSADLTLPRSPRGPEPLVAVYGPKALTALEERVAAGEHALVGLLGRDGLTVAVLEGAALARFGDPADLFRNVNTPDDLRGL